MSKYYENTRVLETKNGYGCTAKWKSQDLSATKPRKNGDPDRTLNDKWRCPPDPRVESSSWQQQWSQTFVLFVIKRLYLVGFHSTHALAMGLRHLWTWQLVGSIIRSRPTCFQNACGCPSVWSKTCMYVCMYVCTYIIICIQKYDITNIPLPAIFDAHQRVRVFKHFLQTSSIPSEAGWSIAWNSGWSTVEMTRPWPVRGTQNCGRVTVSR